MSRYFIEVAYNGKRYAGFQKQANANTVQAEVEKVLSVFFKSTFFLTGSSRTDAGVHAFQNYFHFDTEIDLLQVSASRLLYHLNAMLPLDIVVKSLQLRDDAAHCRFDAHSRSYNYTIYREKNPFLSEYAYFYPYTIDLSLLNAAAGMLFQHTDYEAFSKKSTQVHTYLCQVLKSEWVEQDKQIMYRVEANRFLRGMVRGLVGTMLLVGRGKIDLEEFKGIIQRKDSSRVNFAVPAHGLTLTAVNYPAWQ